MENNRVGMVGLVGAVGAIAAISYTLGKRHRSTFESKVIRARPTHFAKSAYAKEIHVATNLAIKGAAHIAAALSSTEKDVSFKGTADLVTQTDIENERMIFSALRQAFPTHKFIGEEDSAKNGLPQLTDDPTWIVDPVDGTTNFYHGVPLCCVSIALVVKKVAVVGAVCSATGEMFQAVRGCGSFLNGKRAHSQTCTKLSETCAITEWGGQRDEDLGRICDGDRKVVTVGNCHGIRQFGSGVLDICYVGVGRAGAVYCGVGGKGWCAWDYAAGSVIAEEAGCKILSVNGAPFELMGRSILVGCTEQIANELVELLAPHVKTQ